MARPTWWQRLHASDPGSVRLAMSVRACANLAVVLGVMDVLAGALGLTGTPRLVVLIIGAVLGMVASFTTADPTPLGRTVTQLCLPVAMLALITLSTLVDHHRVLSLVLFVVVMMVIVWARRFGPRAFACGMVGWIGYFMALFLQLSFEQVPLVALALAVTTVVLVVLTSLVAPMLPNRRLRRMVDAVTARVHVARWDAARGRYADGSDEHALAVALLRTNEAAVLVDGQLAVPRSVRNPASAPAIRAAVLRVELSLAALLEAEAISAGTTSAGTTSAGTVSAGTTRAADPDPAADAATAAASRELDAALERLTTVVADDRAGRVDAPDPEIPQPFTPGAWLFAGFLPGSAVTVGAMFDPQDPGREKEAPTEVARSGRSGFWARMSLTNRQALQIGVASALAIALGDVISGQRWYWAVLACFLAFTGTATSTEATRKAGQRTVGTVVGVVLALLVVPLFGHSVPIALTVMFVALFVGFYFFRVSYTVLAVGVTVLVAELYELMGSLSDGLLWLRVFETLLGAVIGAVVAVSVLPTSAGDAETAARAQLAEDLRDALAEVAASIRGRGDRSTARVEADGSRTTALHERLRVLDAGIHQLAVIGVPLMRREIPGTGVSRDDVRRRLAAWVRCAVRVRAVVHAVEDAPAGWTPGHPQVSRAIASVHDLSEGLVLGAPVDLDTGGENDVGRLREISALHGALAALQEIDGCCAENEDLTAADDVDDSAPVAGPSSRRLSGAARGRDGDDADLVVTLVDGNGRQHGRARAVDGRYELLLPGPGTWQLVAGAPGHAPRADRIVVGAGAHAVRHDIALEPAARCASACAVRGEVPLAGW